MTEGKGDGRCRMPLSLLLAACVTRDFPGCHQKKKKVISSVKGSSSLCNVHSATRIFKFSSRYICVLWKNVQYNEDELDAKREGREN